MGSAWHRGSTSTCPNLCECLACSLSPSKHGRSLSQATWECSLSQAGLGCALSLSKEGWCSLPPVEDGCSSPPSRQGCSRTERGMKKQTPREGAPSRTGAWRGRERFLPVLWQCRFKPCYPSLLCVDAVRCRGFCARSACMSRVYHYLVPLTALLPSEASPLQQDAAAWREGGESGSTWQQYKCSEEEWNAVLDFNRALRTFEVGFVPTWRQEDFFQAPSSLFFLRAQTLHFLTGKRGKSAPTYQDCVPFSRV